MFERSVDIQNIMLKRVESSCLNLGDPSCVDFDKDPMSSLGTKQA